MHQKRGAREHEELAALAWLVGSPEAKKVPRLVRLFPEIFFYRVLLLLSPRTPKNVIKENREKYGFDFFCRFLCKNVLTRFCCKTFFVASF
jgi:hypothetical protein